MGIRLLALTFALAGCGEVAVVDGAEEAECQRAVQRLAARGVTATRMPSSQGQGWQVTVDADEVPRAVAALGDMGNVAPAQHDVRPVLEGLASERARLDRAVAERLAQSLQRIDGVVWASVHLAEAPTPRLDEPLTPAARRASVAVQLRAGAALDQSAVQHLVAHAMRDLSPADVSVLVTSMPRAPSAPPLSAVGPFRVAPSSAPPLRLALCLLLASNIVLAAIGLWRGRRPLPAADPPRG